jgi:hypothetical protein
VVMGGWDESLCSSDNMVGKPSVVVYETIPNKVYFLFRMQG